MIDFSVDECKILLNILNQVSVKGAGDMKAILAIIDKFNVALNGEAKGDK